MQSFETRMRRAVQKENNDLQSSSSAAAAPAAASKTTVPSSSRGAEKRRTRQRQPIKCGLIIIVLSPIVILLLIICSSRIYNTWSLSNKIELSTILTTKEADAQEVNNQTNKKNKINNNNNNKGLLRRKEDQKPQKQDEDKIKQQQKEEEEQKNAGSNNNFKSEQKKILVLVTIHGNIRITLRPELSQGSVDYIHQLVESYGEGERCMHCNLYRSEKPGILQGIMENENVVPVNTVRGTCPSDGVSEYVVNDCPEWDKNCGCHGPVMTRGSVAWAAGDAGGPDFFIDGYPEPANFWGTQHTNFGTIEEEDSFKILDFVFTLPITAEDGMDFLKEPIHFDLRLE